MSDKYQKAFTLSEAILTMTILGIIAVISISQMKPAQYTSQANAILKEKIYSELNAATQSIIIECTQGADLRKVYYNSDNPESCDRALPTSRPTSSVIRLKCAKYLGAVLDSTECPVTTINSVQFMSGIKLKNGACIHFKALQTDDENYNENNIGKILIDVNGKKGPNSIDADRDRIILNLGAHGITTKMSEL